MSYLTRREAIMSGEDLTPMNREEAILKNQAGLKVFTKEEQLRLNNYVRTVNTSSEGSGEVGDDQVSKPLPG